MKINKNFKIWKAIKEDEFRPAMEFIHFRNGYAYASDAHILVKIPINELMDFSLDIERTPEENLAILDGYSIHAKVWQHLAGVKGVIKLFPPQYENELPFFSVDIDSGGAQVVRFPVAKKDFYKVPDFDGVLKPEANTETISKIGISISLLNNLAQALGAENLKLEFSAENRKIIVRPLESESMAYGLIMPRICVE